MSFGLSAPKLEGQLVRLEPLAHSHADDLARAAEEDRASYQFTWVPLAGEVNEYIEDQLRRGGPDQFAPYAQIERSTGRAVGVTAYWNPRQLHDGDGLHAVEVGFTWLGSTVQGTGLNLEAKYLLFRNAFESWGALRVDLKTDARNARSRAAIERAGAKFEGVLRSWSRSWAPGEHQMLRDSAMFSITAREWPERRARLERVLETKIPSRKPAGEPH